MKEEKSKKKLWINLYSLYKHKINIYIARDHSRKFISLHVHISDVGSRLKGGGVVRLIINIDKKEIGEGGGLSYPF